MTKRRANNVILAYMVLMGVLATWGGFEAFAQQQVQPIPMDAIVAETGRGGVLLDLGNLTLPGALVVCVWLIVNKFSDGIPVKMKMDVMHYHREVPPAYTGVVNDPPSGPWRVGEP